MPRIRSTCIASGPRRSGPCARASRARCACGSSSVLTVCIPWRSGRTGSPCIATSAPAGTSTSRCSRPCGSPNTSCTSRPLASNARPVGPGDAWLSDPDAHLLDRQRFDEGVGGCCGEGFEQSVTLCVVDGADDVAHLPVVDCRPDRVLLRLGNFERDVEEEALAVAPLVVVHAVTAVELEPVHLDDHPDTTAAATFRASTCSRTSWARRIVAPRSYAATAAATLAAT